MTDDEITDHIVMNDVSSFFRPFFVNSLQRMRNQIGDQSIVTSSKRNESLPSDLICNTKEAARLS